MPAAGASLSRLVMLSCSLSPIRCLLIDDAVVRGCDTACAVLLLLLLWLIADVCCGRESRRC